MTKTIAFFPHNLAHLKFFTQVGNHLKKAHGSKIIYIRELGDIPGEEVFQFEHEIEKIYDKIDISYSALCKLKNEYPHAMLMRALYCERRFNYLPKFFNSQAISYDKQLSYMVACFDVFNQFLASKKIDYIVSELLIGLPDSILYEVCKKRNVQYISIRPSKLIPGVIKCNPECESPKEIMNVYKKFLDYGIPPKVKDMAVSHVNEIRAKIAAPPYMESSKKNFRFIDLQRLPSLLAKFGKERMRTNSISRFRHPILESFLWHFHRLFNIWGTRANASRWFCKEIPEKEKYFVFPLQYEPESSTLVRAFPFSDQMGVIQQIVKLLPLGVTLVVKEHRGNHGYRKPSFYRDLHYLPNVRLVSREADVHKIIRNSLGVITLSSRMGWEALVLRKPVIMLGTSFWGYFEDVKAPGSWSEFSSIVEACVDVAVDGVEHDYEKRLIAYAAAYIYLTREGIFLAKNNNFNSEKNVKNIANIILAEREDPQ